MIASGVTCTSIPLLLVCRLKTGACRFSLLVIIAGFVSLLNGCLSRPSLVRQSFTFTTPASQTAVGTNSGRVLAVSQLTVAAPFAGPSFVYRTGEVSYEQDPYAQFLVPPADSLAEPIRGYLRNSGKFQTVLEPGSAQQPNLLVEIDVPQLYGDFRNHAAPAAVLAMHLVCFEASKGRPGKMLSQNTYSQKVPLQARTAAALMAGWNRALERIMSEAAAGLAAGASGPLP